MSAMQNRWVARKPAYILLIMPYAVMLYRGNQRKEKIGTEHTFTL